MRTIIQEMEQRLLFYWSNMMGHFSLAYILDWGWLRIGPPYIYLNIDPVIFHLGPLALRWYGLMYVVGIILALWIIRGYTERKGIDQDMVYRVLWWCIAAGLIGGRLYFVIQQPNLVDYYLANPIHIIATWEGGMAFYGAIFLVIPTLIWRARVERINPLVLVDAGVLFAAAGQIFGRVGNLINGDIIGYPSTLPWSTVYQHPASWACLRPETCNVPVQPAAGYELIINLILLATMLFLAKRVRRPGVLMLVYLYTYAITQFLIFFTRANDIVSFLGMNPGLKQAQWTSLVVLVALLPITYWLLRFSKPVPRGAVAATYGITQKPVTSDTVTQASDEPTSEIPPEEETDKTSQETSDDISDEPTIMPPTEETVKDTPDIPDEPTDEIPPEDVVAKNDIDHSEDEQTIVTTPENEADKEDEKKVEEGNEQEEKKVTKDEETIQGEVKDVPEEPRISGKKSK